jgi:hypothetical protein
MDLLWSLFGPYDRITTGLRPNKNQFITGLKNKEDIGRQVTNKGEE